MCECLRRDDGTWHVDECCADIMDDYHSGKFATVPARRAIREQFAEEIIASVPSSTMWEPFTQRNVSHIELTHGYLRQLAKEQPK